MIKIITGRNWSEDYYVDNEDKLHSGSTGSVDIRDFVRNCKIESKYFEYHPDLVYMENGVGHFIQAMYPFNYKYFSEIPKWAYSKDTKNPLINQLTEYELEEFNKFNTGKHKRCKELFDF